MVDRSTTVLDYVEDMIHAADKIERFVEGMDREAFVAVEKTVDAVLRNLEVIGEASKLIPEPVREDHPDIPWAEMAGMRDILIHGCATVDLDIVWTTVVEDLPGLRARLIELKEDLEQ
ncbi:MAG: DUF86 domain-containing protein [Halobacteriales archaeon]